MVHYTFILLFFIATLVGCSSEDRKATTDRQAEQQVERIKAPIDKAKEAAALIEQHNNQSLPDQ